MSYARYLRELLRPLGVYDLGETFNGGELDSAGAALDGEEAQLEELWRESSPITAEGWGLERMAALFSRRPAADDSRSIGQALAALLRIGGDSFTLEAINSTIAGCGVPARVMETGAGRVSVFFPEVRGIPTGFDQIREIVEEILPPHLEISYWFDFLTWAELEGRSALWRDIGEMSWEALETSINHEKGLVAK